MSEDVEYNKESKVAEWDGDQNNRGQGMSTIHQKATRGNTIGNVSGVMLGISQVVTLERAQNGTDYDTEKSDAGSVQLADEKPFTCTARTNSILSMAHLRWFVCVVESSS